MTPEWWERAGALAVWGEEKMRFTCGDLVRERGGLCGTLSKPWGLAEVRRIEKQAEGGRIYEDAVCREVLDPDDGAPALCSPGNSS